MYNWSVDETKFKTEDPEGYQIWRLEQLINYGLGKDKLNSDNLKKYWGQLNIDPLSREYLEFLLWPTKSKY